MYILLLAFQFIISFTVQALLIGILSFISIITLRMAFESLDYLSISLTIITVLVIGITSFKTYKILKYKISKKWKLIGLLAAHFIATAILIMPIIFFTFFFDFFAPQQETYKNPKDCNLETLSEIKKCKGYGIFGFQNNYDYDIRAYGSANKKLCEKYKNSDYSDSLLQSMRTTEDVEKGFGLYGVHTCDFNEPEKSWIPVECNFAEYPEITNCYGCSRGLSNGNGHRFGLVAYSEDCKTGAYVFLAQWRSILIEKIYTLIPLDNQEEPPEILIENTDKKSRGIF